MWYSIEEDNSYGFELQRGVLASSPVVEKTIGGFLLRGLADVERVKSIANGRGLSNAVRHFEAHVATKVPVRNGDFGEVVAGHLLEDAEGVERLIEKLRHRESPDWPMKLTDVFCVDVDDDEIVGFLFGEAKAGTTARPPRKLGLDAYESVYKDIEDEEPPILFFTLDKLLYSDDPSKYIQLDEAMHKTPPVSRALRLVFVFDEQVWRDDILEALHDDLSSGELTLAEDFKFYLLARDGLRDLISGAYAEAEWMAAND